jgi:hypothetical protein
MLEMKYLIFLALLTLSSTPVFAVQENDRCIDEFMQLVAIVDDVGKGELRKPPACETSEAVMYNRFIDDTESVVASAMLRLRHGPGSQFSCAASLSYFDAAVDPPEFLSDYPTEKHHYTYSDRDQFEAVKSQKNDLCESWAHATPDLTSEPPN